jgi:hypothetical protein
MPRRVSFFDLLIAEGIALRILERLSGILLPRLPLNSSSRPGPLAVRPREARTVSGTGEAVHTFA